MTPNPLRRHNRRERPLWARRIDRAFARFRLRRKSRTSARLRYLLSRPGGQP